MNDHSFIPMPATSSRRLAAVKTPPITDKRDAILKAAGQKAPEAKPVLEINPKHPVVLRLRYEEKKFDDWAAVLFDQALLAEGGQLDDPASFVKRMNQLLLEMSGG